MSVKKLLLVTTSLLCANTTTYAKISPERCAVECTQAFCKNTHTYQQCETDCPGTCGASNKKEEAHFKPQPPIRLPISASPKPPSLESAVKPIEKDTSVSSGSDLSKQLLDKNAEQFYKEIIGDQYATFKAAQCVSASITFNKQVDFEALEKQKNTILSKIKSKINQPTNVFKSYTDYMLSIGEYCQSFMQTYLVMIFEKLSQSQYKMQVTKRVGGLEGEQELRSEIVSPFATELEGVITKSIDGAASIASKIPGFRGDRKPDKAGTFHVFFNALPSEHLNKLEQCMKPVQFHADDLKKFQGELLEYIQHYQSKNKAESMVGSTPKK